MSEKTEALLKLVIEALIVELEIAKKEAPASSWSGMYRGGWEHCIARVKQFGEKHSGDIP